MMYAQHQRYLVFIGLTSIVSWTGWVLVLNNLDPCIEPGEIMICADTDALAMILFFVSLFFALTTTFAMFGYFLRLWFNRHELFVNNINLAIRQGILLALVGLGSTGMLALGVLRWWSGLLLIAIIVLLELYMSRAA